MQLTLLTLFLVAGAQTPADAPPSNDATAQQVQAATKDIAKPIPPTGIWPTPRMVEGVLLRWAGEISESFELTEDQRQSFERQLLDRWPTFLEAHRATLQPLFNEYVESRISYTPPDPEAVQKWSDRAMPVFEKLRDEVLDTQRDMTEFLTPEQQAQLARISFKMTAGLELSRAKLESWRRGQFDEREWWDAPHSARNRERTPSADAPDSSISPPRSVRSRIDDELLRWDAFVAKFIETYHLIGTQRESAHSILRECKDRAATFRDQNRLRTDRLEQDIDGAEKLTDVQRDEIVAVYGPVDELFAELKARIEQIPTTAQSAAAEDAGADATPAANGNP